MSADIEALFIEHGSAVLGYLVRRVAIAEDAADLLSETILVAWRRRTDVPAPPDDRPWLYGVARNVLSNHHRSNRRRDATTLALAGLVSQVSVPGPEVSLDVRRALAGLDPVDREIVTLSAWEALTSGEIARVVDLPPSTVRARLARARAVVRSALVVDV